MKKVNELNIKINKAIITKIEVDLSNGEPAWTVSGQLITSTGHNISSFYFSTSGWSEKNKIEAPVSVNYLGRSLFELFTPTVMEKIMGTFKSLPSGKKENPIPDDIPF